MLDGVKPGGPADHRAYEKYSSFIVTRRARFLLHKGIKYTFS